MLAVQDERTPFRALWAAEELLTHDIALERAGDLAIAALAQSRLATEREGSIRERPELAATDRQKWFQARAYYLLGKLRLRQEQNPQAAQYFQLAIDNFPASAEQRAAASYLATTLQAMGQETEALALYLKNYNPYDQNAAVQRTLIQNLYRKIHGSLEGLQLK
jgi:tetratricopeptide (TPR) repeat protein